MNRLNSVQEIEHAIEALPPEQLEELCVWFEERYSQAVDARLEADIQAGLFDERISRAIADYEGRTN